MNRSHALLLTFGLVVTRGTRQPRQNVAIYRQQLLGRNRVAMRWLPHRGGALDFADFRAAHARLSALPQVAQKARSAQGLER